MFRPVAFAAVLLFAAGCPMMKSPQALMEEQVAAMNEVTSVLDGITDDATAAAAMPRLDKAAARLRAANEAARQTQTGKSGRQPTPEEMNRALEMAKPLMDAGLRMTAAALKAQVKAPLHAAKIKQVLDTASVR